MNNKELDAKPASRKESQIMRRRLCFGLIMFSLSLFGRQTSATEGRTVGQFNVSRYGTAQYTIPIWAAPGPKGMQPNISLFYDSLARLGPLGIGWSLSGLGEIARCDRTVAQDSASSPVALITTDGYCINGSRLRVTSGLTTYGLDGSTYQTEVADFSNITAHGSAGNAGPAYFTAQTRNGLTYTYGHTDGNGNGANSQILAAGTAIASEWLLSSVSDRAGNNYVINYTTFGGTLIGAAVPNTILWTPTSAGATTYTYTMQFNYETNAPQSSISKYVAGTLVSNPKLLQSVQILYDGTSVKDYILSYSQSSSTGREELVSVQECVDSSKANCLLPTNISYETGPAGIPNAPTTALNGSGTNLTARYDLNGDGYPDLVYYESGSWYVAWGSSSGYSSTVNTLITASAPGFLIGNLNGANQDGILANNGGTWYYYTWNGTAFVGVSTHLSYDTTASQYQLADINGDGLPDLVTVYLTLNVSVTLTTRLNTLSGTTPGFGSPTTAYSQTGIIDAELQTPDTQYGKLRRYDFNGDGLDDLALIVTTARLHGEGLNSVFELLSNGSGFTAYRIEQAIGGNFSAPFFVNWNDDACTDYAYGNTVYVSGCNGTVPVSFAISGTIVAALDWDADGRTDLVVANGTTLGVYLSTGAGVNSTIVTTSIPYTSTCQYVTMDANGDGLDDLGCWSETGSNPVTYDLHNGTTDLLTKVQDGYGNYISPTYVSLAAAGGVYTKGSGAVYPEEDYVPSLYVVSQTASSDGTGSSYTNSYHYTQARGNLQGRGFEGFGVINTVDSRSGTNHLQYYQQSFPFTGELSEDQLEQSNGTNITVLNNNWTSTTLNGAPNNQRVFAYISQSTSKSYEVGGIENGVLLSTTVSNFSFDNFGNATTVTTTITDNDPGPQGLPNPYEGKTWTTSTTNTTDISVNQSTDLAAWCLTMLDETQVVYSSTLSGSTPVTRTQIFTPDTPTACRIKTTVTEPTANNGAYKVTEALAFDSFGNVQTDTITGANMPSSPATRVTTLNWGTTGQFLNQFTDATNATATWNYTSNQALTFGVPDNVKSANNLTTSWSYDAFGRKDKEARPDGTSTTWTWSACTSSCGWSNSVYQIAQTTYQTNGTTLIRTDTTSYDPLDRVTQVAGPTVTGAIATIQSLYNPMGLLAQRSMPFLSGTPYHQSFLYDTINRLTSTTRPISSMNSLSQTTGYVYTGRRFTVTDPYGHQNTTLTDVNGWLRQTTDALGYSITKAYDSAGSVIGITDSVGNTLLKNVTVNYGIKPFRVGATDADRGAWSYSVDSLGERIGWTDAKGQSFSMTYDALSRPLTRTEPDLFSQWTWGSTPASFNVGQLIAQCTGSGGACSSTAYSETRTFDSLGRLSKRSVQQGGNPGNDPGGVFLFTTAYSATTGFLNSLTYPISTSGFALNLQYGYGFGLLSSVTDTSDSVGTCGSVCTLWTANSMNAFGQITQETLGNGVVLKRTYDAVTSWLGAATGGVGGGAALLNQSYLEDENGNVIQRQNNNQGLTESFAYDADTRLTCAALSSTCTTPTLAYDAGAAGPGNITSQSGLGTYSYPAAGQPRPHAVTGITGTFNGIVNPTFSYDANGNMTNRASSSQNITWFSNNYPATISATDVTGSEEVQFTYGPDRQRWKQFYTGPSGTETTYYVGGLIDLVFNGTTNYRQYIYAGAEPIGVYSRTSTGVNTMSYMLEDHQGSVSAIASSAGVADVNESFSAFGTRRNPATWSGAPSTTDLNTIASLSRQGYTFQTWLGQSMGLNHMNGRVQDAILGRFLSADPYVPDRSNAQSYNRYTYVNNNPLGFIDPSGFCGTTVTSVPDVVTYDDAGDLVVLGTPDRYGYYFGDCTADFGNAATTPGYGLPAKPAIVPIQPPVAQRPLPPCMTFADDMAARKSEQTTNSDALAAVSMTNDFLGVTADTTKMAADSLGQDVSALEKLSNASTVVGGGYTAYQGYVAISTSNQDAAFDAAFGAFTLATSRIPVVGAPIATGMTLSNLLLSLAFPKPVEMGPLSRYAASAPGQCTPQNSVQAGSN